MLTLYKHEASLDFIFTTSQLNDIISLGTDDVCIPQSLEWGSRSIFNENVTLVRDVVLVL